MADVYLVMGNDFPDCVFAESSAAEAYVEAKEVAQKEARNPNRRRIYWRVYAFEVR